MIHRRLKFDSGNIAEIGYDQTSQTMEVVFRDVPEYVYTYENVPVILFCGLINAESVGAAFAASVRKNQNNYPFTKSLTGKMGTTEAAFDTKGKKT